VPLPLRFAPGTAVWARARVWARVRRWEDTVARAPCWHHAALMRDCRR